MSVSELFFGSDNVQIVSIIPAVGWSARYEDEDSPGGELLTPLVCFALVEVLDSGDTYRRILGVTIGDDGEADFCTSASNFLGFARP